MSDGTPVRRLTVTWGLLVGATLVTGWLAETQAGLHWVAIIVIASTKIAVVMCEFMDLRIAPVVWRVVMGSWLTVAVVTAIVLAGHVLG